MPEKIQELNVYLVPINNRRILILKNKNGFWEFPGGGVDFGEHPRKSAIRECKEETGLEAYGVELIGVTSAVYEWHKKQKHAVYIVYKGEVGETEVNISKEHSDYRWIQQGEEKGFKVALNAREIFNMIKA